ncbi:hypothetical protein EMIHUDRAFT_257077 [Emiliania huxleyi CCMP1516]|uniref:Secreted protein n=2 Tax=Emiliania huxleyi TaxID=2903 RepID=A0A0D3IN96_EMIH1|nr:hypothetical protein EMIHUDRAFT_257077 [Emiliania huxleyi CCMP1516]EOD12731.1 hypothetical protein EMIHUDRAFT_257077 [Emiliania huxleyi CCMP1516]|eukprot:XP_005765160.1 hypothetical protein EMIHUDRAFT_257077 [Emiliania huxleyi CCMP1516]
MACLTAATGRRLGASARLGVAIVASATRLDSTLSQELPHALARSLYNKLYSKIALYIALQRRRLVPRRMTRLERRADDRPSPAGVGKSDWRGSSLEHNI